MRRCGQPQGWTLAVHSDTRRAAGGAGVGGWNVVPACWAASAGAEPRGGVVVVDGQRWNPLLQLVRSIAECLGEQLRPGRAPGRPRPAVGRGRGRGRRGPACPARRRVRSPDPPGRFGPQPLGGVESQVVGAGGLGPAGPVVSPCPPAVGSGQGDLELLGSPLLAGLSVRLDRGGEVGVGVAALVGGLARDGQVASR